MGNVKTLSIKLRPSVWQEKELHRMSQLYIDEANKLIKTAVTDDAFPVVTSKHINAPLPSSVKNELIRYAKTKHKQFGHCVFKRKTTSWNNQNFSVTPDAISFPVLVDGEVKKTAFRALIPAEMYEVLSTHKLGGLRISKKQHRWIAQISYHAHVLSPSIGTETLGVDLGILCPAVAVVASSGKTQFFGNGRQNKYLRRKYKALRRELGRAKKVEAVKRLNNKESRIMRDINHKLSREIVDYAVRHDCGTINLEQLSGIRRTSKIGGKTKSSLHNWTFYELTTLITYKAQDVGITVNLIDPKYTSQTCFACGTRNKTHTRTYACSCGYTTHRDRLGALNIATSRLSGHSSVA